MRFKVKAAKLEAQDFRRNNLDLVGDYVRQMTLRSIVSNFNLCKEITIYLRVFYKRFQAIKNFTKNSKLNITT